MVELPENFEVENRKLVSLCYRMLGERAAAEDAAQEAWVKWTAADKSRIENSSAWLRKVATNISIDVLRSAQRSREVYVGPWLPEPLIQEESGDVERNFELAQECELALVWAMERLSAKERAAFILREAFDASYSEIAVNLNTTQTACRQLVSRSQKKLREAGPRFDASAEEVAGLSQRFFMAVMAEDFDAALTMLTPNSTVVTDGGANKRAARRPLVGGEEIIQVFRALLERAKRETGWTTQIAVANSKPAFLRLQDGVLDSVITLAPDEAGKIAWIYILRNPDKLGERTNCSSGS